MADAYRRFAEADALLEKALAIPSGERVAFLAEACGNDEELKEVLVRLVEAALEDDSAFEQRTELAALGARAVALAPEPETALEPGSRFGAYVVVGTIGAGGMGEVYRARDQRLGREVALKALPAEFDRDPERLARLEREARLLAALNHPHINTIHELEEADGRKALVLELVEGRTLAERLGENPIPLRQALVWMQQIARALEVAHGRGVLHRDLKPANIKITNEGQIKVLDFGLAVSLGTPAGVEGAAPPDPAALTGEGRVMGTAPYMSPERWRGQPADRGSDLWAFGCILYEVLTGARAFDGRTRADSAAAVLEREPDWKALPSQTPRRVQELLRRCLEKDPARRLADAGEAADAIEQALAESGDDRHARPGAHVWALVAIVVLALAFGAARLFFFSPDDAERPAALGAIDSIAVLPFDNAGDTPEDEYLSDGLTESLINSLSKLPNLRVAPRGVVFAYKGKSQDAVEAASELGVRAVLTGRVGERDGTLMLSAELVDAEEVAQLWGEQYTRPANHLIEVREELVQSIVEELRLQLTPEQRRRAIDPATENPEAFRLFLRANYHTFKLTPEGLDRGLEYAQQAVDLDPGFALAYVALSQAHMTRAFVGLEPWSGAGDLSRAATRRALELDETLSEAHVEMGFVRHHFDWDWTGAERAFAHAIELDPENADALQGYSEALLSLGRLDDALDNARRATTVNPINPNIYSWLSSCAFHGGRYDEALRANEAALDLEPEHLMARGNAPTILLMSEREDEAIAVLRADLAARGAAPSSSLLLAFFYAWVGRDGEARDILQGVVADGTESMTPYAEATLAKTLGGLGEMDRAFDIVERLYENRSRALLWINTDPTWKPLRADPRFANLVRRMGLPLVESTQ